MGLRCFACSSFQNHESGILRLLPHPPELLRDIGLSVLKPDPKVLAVAASRTTERLYESIYCQAICVPAPFVGRAGNLSTRPPHAAADTTW